MGRASRRIGGKANGNLELTDKTFLWPSGLVHYVRDHDARLPTAFIEHALYEDERRSARRDDRAAWWRCNAHPAGLRDVLPPEADDDD